MLVTKDETLAIIKILKEGGNIYNIARALNITIARASRKIGTLAKKSEKARKYFKLKKVPMNITVGHIFIGSKFLQKGQKYDNMLNIGDYVIVTDEFTKNGVTYCEIGHAEEMTEDLYEFGIVKRPDIFTVKEIKNTDASCIKCHWPVNKCCCYDNLRNEEYFADDDILNGRIQQFAKKIDEDSSRVYFKKSRSKKSRIVYRPGRWQGTPEKRALVSVNYNWR